MWSSCLAGIGEMYSRTIQTARYTKHKQMVSYSTGSSLRESTR